jgi:hypothetical protein
MSSLLDPPDAADPFDLDALRAAPDLDIDVEKILTTVPVRRPGKNEFFRVQSTDTSWSTSPRWTERCTGLRPTCGSP